MASTDSDWKESESSADPTKKRDFDCFGLRVSVLETLPIGDSSTGRQGSTGQPWFAYQDWLWNLLWIRPPGDRPWSDSVLH